MKYPERPRTDTRLQWYGKQTVTAIALTEVTSICLGHSVNPTCPRVDARRNHQRNIATYPVTRVTRAVTIRNHIVITFITSSILRTRECSGVPCQEKG